MRTQPVATPVLLALAAVTLASALAPGPLAAQQKTLREEYDAFYYGQEGDAFAQSFVQSVSVIAPDYGAYVKDDFTVVFKAPGMTEVKAFCWQQPANGDRWGDGHDELVATLKTEGDKTASFVVRANNFPNGPMVLRFYAKNDTGQQDYCELQLFNLGGKVWRQGIPPSDPPGAKGLKLVFCDDFDGPLSVSSDGKGARYAAHKTGGGDFSGWPFSDPEGDKQPFSQQGTYLRIHASKPWGTKGRSGILSSIRSDGTGVCVPVPSYFECRFVAHSAPGSWPAFWTLTKGTISLDKADPQYDALRKMGTDELDIIEAYGGYGARNPNSRGTYCSVSHFWNQDPQPVWSLEKRSDGTPNPEHVPTSLRTDTLALGERSSWSWTSHTYGLAITETDTIYYFDNTEIGRHPTGPVSRAQPAWFLINYAIGGISGWTIDMARYGNTTDMWIDFVRVYCGCAQSPEIAVTGFAGGARPARVACSTPTPGGVIRYTLDGTDPTEQSPVYAAPLSVDKPTVVKAIAFAEGVKPSPASRAAVIPPPGVPGGVGINFLSAESEDQALAKSDVAGIDAEAQANWNAVAPGATALAAPVTSDGDTIAGLTLRIEGEAKPATGEPWGFDGNALKLRRGGVQPSPRLLLTGIPYAHYDVIVYLGAGPNAMQGTVSVQKSGNAQGLVDPKGGYAFDFTWLNGKNVAATQPAGEKAEGANVVRFRGNTASDIEIQLKPTGGKGWIGISAIQIIPRPPSA